MSDSVDTELPTPCTEDRTFSFAPCPSVRFMGDRPSVDSHGSNPPQDSSDKNHLDNVECHAVERLVQLKRKLRVSESEQFWDQMMGDLTSTCGAQFGFIVQTAPSSGTGNSQHPQGLVLYYNDGRNCMGLQSDRSSTDGIPLSHMDEDEPCLIPSNLGSLFHLREKQVSFIAEACLSIPLFSQGHCLAHLGLMWSQDGLRELTLPWLSLKMALYSLEDLVVQRLLIDAESKKPSQQCENLNPTSNPKVVHDAPHVHNIAPCKCPIQPLKPYARSLSHELRTPMHGVVGLLDVMHATVREAMECKDYTKTNDVFHYLKENIEMVQDSARRAVEAADNVVHAYDLNMQVPETPQKEIDNGILGGPVLPPPVTREGRPNVFSEGSNITMNPCKRRRSNSDRDAGPAQKQMVMRVSSQEQCSPRSQEVKDAVHESGKIMQANRTGQFEEAMVNMANPRPSLAVRRSAPHFFLEGLKLRDPSLKFTQLRDLLRLVVNESLQVGGRPDFAASEKTQFGEKIEIRSRPSTGNVSSKVINWSVDPAFPDTFLVDNRDLAKLISCVFLNAIKFTNTGTITVFATVDRVANSVSISVRDTGLGIPETFLPKLFKPFARQDTSTTQSKDGLGLGLLVAKGLARRMGGDLLCVHSSTTGPDRGSLFEIRIPANQLEVSGNRPTAPAARNDEPYDQQTPEKNHVSFKKPLLQPFFSPARHLLNQPIQQPSPSLTEGSATPTPDSSHSVSIPENGGRTSASNRNTFDSKLGEKHPLTFLVAEDNKINRRVLVNMLKKLGYQDTYEACDGKEAVHVMQDALKSHYSEGQAFEYGDAVSGKPLQHGRGGKAKPVDVVLMDLWMPEMDGYQATSRIFELIQETHVRKRSSTQGLQGCTPSDDTDRYGRDYTTGNENKTTESPLYHSGVVSPPPTPTVLAITADVTHEALERAFKVGIKGYMTKPYKLADLEKLIVEFSGGGNVGTGYMTPNANL